MTHPSKAPGGWKLEYIVYPGGPGEIAVGILTGEVDAPLPDQPTRKITRRMLGLRWCESDSRFRSWQEGAHEWFVLPFTFAAAITRSLLQMKATGFDGFDDAGFQKLVEWMTDYDHQAVDDSLCY
jgi:hypothetical protein